MSNKTWIILAVTLVTVTGALIFFSTVKFEHKRPDNPMSQLHMVIAPATEKNPDWQKLRQCFIDRIGPMGDMRIFQVESGYVVMEISGSDDPSLLASMLLTRGHTLIRIKNNDQHVAAGEEITGSASFAYDEKGEKYGIMIELSEKAINRLEALTQEATPKKSITFELVVDNLVMSESIITKHIQDGLIEFPMTQKTNVFTSSLLSGLLSHELPFDLAINMRQSFFVAPQAKDPSTLELREILSGIKDGEL